MDTATSLVDFSSVKFDTISDSISAAVPSVLPVVLTIIGIRKTISVVMGLVRGA